MAVIIVFGASLGIALLARSEEQPVWYVECYEGERQIFDDYVTGNKYQSYLVETGAKVDLKDVPCVWTEVIK